MAVARPAPHLTGIGSIPEIPKWPRAGHVAAAVTVKRSQRDPVQRRSGCRHGGERCRCRGVGLDAGINDSLFKPVSPETLLTTLSNGCEGPCGGGAHPHVPVRSADPKSAPKCRWANEKEFVGSFARILRSRKIL